MATSGDTVYELTRDNIIAAAMRKCGALAKGQSPETEDLTNGMQALNAVMASLQGIGLTMWKRTEVSVTLTAARTFTIGIGQTVNVAFPLRVESAQLITTTGGQRQELQIMGRFEFNQLNEETTGSPTTICYQPKINLGVLSVWPIPDAASVAGKTIGLTCRTAFEGFNSANETPDFPQEWQNVLIYGLAIAIAPEFGVPLADRQQLMKEYVLYLDMATLATQGEDESVFLLPDRR